MNGAEAVQRDSGHENAGDHEPLRAEASHDPAREKAEERTHHQLAECVARRHLRAGPAEVPHHEVVEEGKTVECQSDDGEQRHERRRGHLYLFAAHELRRSLGDGSCHCWKEVVAGARRAATGGAGTAANNVRAAGHLTSAAISMSDRRDFLLQLAALSIARPTRAASAPPPPHRVEPTEDRRYWVRVLT